MESVPHLITDLAYILITAGITTLLFKRINQPIVLGYLLAGFLVGPNLGICPDVVDSETIKIWGDIGVIFLLFSLGLEFSIKKMLKMGGGAIITSMTIILAMMGAGFAAGHCMGMSNINSIFLGGMICMSSTTIIAKAFSDMGIMEEASSQSVMAVLIFEDVAAIFLMVILSTISVSQNVSSVNMASQLFTMAAYLFVWLVAGIAIIPTLFKLVSKYLNDETMLIMSLAICFAMVMIANALGFSSALGAFLAGSIMAGTNVAEKAEHLVSPLKDLFGAVFFVSVGMMVNLSVISEHVIEVIVITLLVMLGQPICAFVGFLLAGKPPQVSAKGAMAMCQIGEFSLIIAGLGNDLKVTDSFLYAVIVVVTVVTTFTTPYMIKLSEPVSIVIASKLPEKFLGKSSDEADKQEHSDWQNYIKSYFFTLFFYGIITLGLGLLMNRFLRPLLQEYTGNATAASAISVIIYLICILPFFRPLIEGRNKYFTSLFISSAFNRMRLMILVIIRIAIATGIVMFAVYRMWELPVLLILLLIVVPTFLISRMDWIKGRYFRIEATFLANLNERQLSKANDDDAEEGRSRVFLDKYLYEGTFYCPPGSIAAGKTLIELGWGKNLNIQVIKILRGNVHINIPPGKTKIMEGDIISVIGDEKELDNFKRIMEERNALVCSEGNFDTLRDFIYTQETLKPKDQLLCYAVSIQHDSKVCGKSIKLSGIKNKWNCSIIGIEHKRLPLINPDPSTIIGAGDVIWVVGPMDMGHRVLNAKRMS